MSFQSFASLNQWVIEHPTDKVKVALQRLLSSGAGAEGVMRGIPADYARRYALVQRLKYASDGTPSDLTPEEQRTVAENTIAAARAELEDIKATVDAIQPLDASGDIPVQGVVNYRSTVDRYNTIGKCASMTLEERDGELWVEWRGYANYMPFAVRDNQAGILIKRGVGLALVTGSNGNSSLSDLKRNFCYGCGSMRFNNWMVDVLPIYGVNDSGDTAKVTLALRVQREPLGSVRYAILHPIIVSRGSDGAPSSDVVMSSPVNFESPNFTGSYFNTVDAFDDEMRRNFYTDFVSALTPWLQSQSYNDGHQITNPTNQAVGETISSIASPWCYETFAAEGAQVDVWNWLRDRIDRTSSALNVLEDMPLQ